MPVEKENLEDQSKLDVDYNYFDLICNLVKAVSCNNNYKFLKLSNLKIELVTGN